MGRKKKRSIEEVEERIYCYYCERVFDNEQFLLNHQREKHFKCPTCQKKLNTVTGLTIHSEQSHKVKVEKVPNALPGRESIHVHVQGMRGIPQASDGSRNPNASSDSQTAFLGPDQIAATRHSTAYMPYASNGMYPAAYLQAYYPAHQSFVYPMGYVPPNMSHAVETPPTYQYNKHPYAASAAAPALVSSPQTLPPSTMVAMESPMGSEGGNQSSHIAAQFTSNTAACEAANHSRPLARDTSSFPYVYSPGPTVSSSVYTTPLAGLQPELATGTLHAVEPPASHAVLALSISEQVTPSGGTEYTDPVLTQYNPVVARLQQHLVYSNTDESMEEARARLPRYRKMLSFEK